MWKRSSPRRVRDVLKNFLQLKKFSLSLWRKVRLNFALSFFFTNENDSFQSKIARIYFLLSHYSKLFVNFAIHILEAYFFIKKKPREFSSSPTTNDWISLNPPFNRSPFASKKKKNFLEKSDRNRIVISFVLVAIIQRKNIIHYPSLFPPVVE